MSDDEREALIEQAAGAWRPIDPRTGRARPHPAWLDLDDADRLEAFDRASEQRRLEAALDGDGWSAAVRAWKQRATVG
jgi:hypothetical protein